MPARPPARPPARLSAASRRRRRPPPCATPACLCNRALGDSLVEARDFSVVTCSHGCRRPQFYFHASCAQLYAASLRVCGFCKTKLVAVGDTSNRCLQDALRVQRRRRRRRRLGSRVV